MKKDPALSPFLAVLSESTVEELYKKFCTEFSTSEGCTAMTWLGAHRPVERNRLLCYLYDVACYQVDTSCFAPSSPVEDHDKWFVSTPVYSILECDPATVPLADSQAEAEELAVVRFNLVEAFFKKTEQAQDEAFV